MVWPTELSCVCMSGASVVTVMVSDVAPGFKCQDDVKSLLNGEVQVGLGGGLKTRRSWP